MEKRAVIERPPKAISGHTCPVCGKGWASLLAYRRHRAKCSSNGGTLSPRFNYGYGEET